MSETPFVALCLETLGGGAVQSFIDIMYLAAEGSLAFKELADVRSSLVAAESGRRMGDAPAVMSAFASLIHRFKSQGKLRIAVFFMERLLEIAKLTGDAVSEMHAHQDLGEALELLGEDDAALLHHHAHRGIATALDDSDGKCLACTHLVRVYLRQGRRLDAKREHAKSLELYLAAADAAESTGDDLAQAETAFAAGRAYIMTGQPESAVPVLQTYLRLVLACDALAEREMEAYASLASAQLAAGNLDGAAECLDEIVHTEDVDARLLAEAHEQLGVIKARKGDAANAERFLEAAFKGWEELQPTEFADRKRLDKLRVMLGLVRSRILGQTMLDTVLRNDVAGLLEWKKAQGGPMGAMATSVREAAAAAAEAAAAAAEGEGGEHGEGDEDEEAEEGDEDVFPDDHHDG